MGHPTPHYPPAHQMAVTCMAVIMPSLPACQPLRYMQVHDVHDVLYMPPFPCLYAHAYDAHAYDAHAIFFQFGLWSLVFLLLYLSSA